MKETNRQIGQLFQKCTELELKLEEKEAQIKIFQHEISQSNFYFWLNTIVPLEQKDSLNSNLSSNSPNPFIDQIKCKNPLNLKTPKFMSLTSSNRESGQGHYQGIAFCFKYLDGKAPTHFIGEGWTKNTTQENICKL